MKPENEQPGKFTTPAEVRIIRTLPGPIERVWDYLVDPEKRARWFAGGPMEPKKGGKVELFFRHKNIAPDETPPDKMKHVQDPGFKMPATILRWEPPHVLSYTFDEDSDVTFELAAQGKTCSSCSRTALAAKICPASPATRAAGTCTSPISLRCSKARRGRRSGRCMPSSKPNTKNSTRPRR